MFDMAVCSYPSLVLNIFTQYYGLLVFILLLFFYFICRFFSASNEIGEKTACLVFSCFFCFIIILVVAAGEFFEGSINPNQYTAFNNYVNELNHLNFDSTRKQKLNEWVQCSIGDGEISSFEFETFEKNFNEAKKTIMEKEYINKIDQSINK